MGETTMSSHDPVRSREEICLLLTPCLICGDFLEVKIEDVEIATCRTPHLGHVDPLLEHFCQLFEINSGYCWDGQEQVEFCHTCELKVKLLMELQRKLEELTKQLQNEREGLRKVIESSEEAVQAEGIYKRNKKYFRMRGHILGLGNKRVNLLPKKEDLNSDPLAIKLRTDVDIEGTSSSTPHSESKFDEDKFAVYGTRKNPVVQLSITDRMRAETFKRGPSLEENKRCKNEAMEDDAYSSVSSDDMDFDIGDISNSNDSSDPDEYLGIPKRKKRAGSKLKTKIKKEKSTSLPLEMLKVENDSDLLRTTTSRRGGRSRKSTTRPASGPKKANWRNRIRKYSRKPHPDLIVLEDEDLPVLNIGKGKLTIYEYSIDTSTGSHKYLNVTLTRLPNTEDGKEQYKCSKCDKILVLRSELEYVKQNVRAHVWTQHTNRRYQCKLCGKEFKSSYTGRFHIERDHEQKHSSPTSSCSICGKPLKESYIKRHKLSHLGEEEKKKLKESESGILKKEKVQCELCGVSVNKNFLAKHRVMKHNGTEEEKARFQTRKKMCPQCGKCFQYLKSHLEHVHSNDRLFPCLKCERRFKSTSELKTHTTAVHDKVHNFKCDLCPKTFFRKKSLEYHTRFHLNIRPHQCEFCENTFTQSNHLRRHIRIYHQEGSKPGRKTCVRKPCKIAGEPVQREDTFS